MNDHTLSLTVASRFMQIGVTVFERGWLSSNNVLVQGKESTALVDSGYCTHAKQTLSLVQDSLKQRPLDLLLNTHLHSDHCGGNAALQSAFSRLTTLIPPGQAKAVEHWDPVALTHEPTGQTCPAFNIQGVLNPGQTIRLGDTLWEVHAAKGHDPHSIVLFEPTSRVLISADSLWENGFGVVFPELEGIDAFDEVADTLTLIKALDPLTVIPGHGAVFEDVESALQRAHSRLNQFVKSPDKHRRHALKVLIKFKLLEWQSVSLQDLLIWYVNTPYIASIEKRQTSPEPQDLGLSLNSLIAELARSGALRVEGERIIDA